MKGTRAFLGCAQINAHLAVVWMDWQLTTGPYGWGEGAGRNGVGLTQVLTSMHQMPASLWLIQADVGSGVMSSRQEDPGNVLRPAGNRDD